MTQPDSAPQIPTRRAGRWWPWALAAAFVFQVSIVITTAFIASGPGSTAVEPDYYSRAMAWDEQAAALRRAEELGWAVALAPPDAQGRLTLTLADARGRPLLGAEVSAVVFPHADAANRATLALLPDELTGRYTGRAAMDCPGLWEVRLTIRRGPESCEVIRQVEIEP